MSAYVGSRDFLKKGNTHAKYNEKACDCLFSYIQYTSFQSVTLNQLNSIKMLKMKPFDC